jgi:hypothetical protein
MVRKVVSNAPLIRFSTNCWNVSGSVDPVHGTRRADAALGGDSEGACAAADVQHELTGCQAREVEQSGQAIAAERDLI